MAHPRGCIRLDLDESKYSAFVPVIGVYVATASLVSLLAMLYDILSIFRHRQRWLPCHFFSMNSLTLTLMGIAAKLPVDLTTPMPSALDQFSKLSGTSLLCVSMGFLMPSVGLKQNQECLTNLLALSILVITVVINICIQIGTGVIFLFRIEHIIVMCCMLALLVELWICFIVVAAEKDFSLDHNKDLFKSGEGSMIKRLKLAYLYGYNYNPQFVLCRKVENYIVGGFCLVCLVVLIQAAIRYLSLNFCGGNSDYGWSIWVIALVQSVTVFVGTFCTSYRSLSLSSRVKMSWSDKFIKADAKFDIVFHPLLRMNTRDWCVAIVKVLMICGAGLVSVLVYVPFGIAFKVVGAMIGLVFNRKHQEVDIDLEFRYLLSEEGEMSLQEWGLMKSVKNMKRWMKTSESKSVKNASDSVENPSAKLRKAPKVFGYYETEVSSLSLVVLIRIAQLLLPSERSDCFVQAYDEVYEIIHFVEDRVKTVGIQDRKKSKLAKAVWMGHEFSKLYLPPPPTTQFDHFDLILEVLEKKLPDDLVRTEALIITRFIRDKHGVLASSLAVFLDQLFYFMLYTILTELPNAIHKEVTETTAEGFFESVKTSLGILWKFKSLETHTRWSFQEESDIRDLTSDSQIQGESVSGDHLHLLDSLPHVSSSCYDNDVIVQVD